jgi:hypothetical protein
MVSFGSMIPRPAILDWPARRKTQVLFLAADRPFVWARALILQMINEIIKLEIVLIVNVLCRV